MIYAEPYCNVSWLWLFAFILPYTKVEILVIYADKFTLLVVTLSGSNKLAYFLYIKFKPLVDFVQHVQASDMSGHGKPEDGALT